jgi:hypothetical protein
MKCDSVVWKINTDISAEHQYLSTPQENHTTLKYCSYNKVLSHDYLFAVTESLIQHTEENHVPTVDLKPPLLSVCQHTLIYFIASMNVKAAE